MLYSIQFNVITFLQLCGLGILGAAIFLRVDSNTHPSFTGHENIHQYYIATYVLMTIGTLMAIIGFLGCCGALRQSRCMLGTYFALLIVVFLAEIAGGVAAYKYKDFLTRAYVEKGFAEIVRTEYGKPGFEARSQYFDVVQTEVIR